MASDEKALSASENIGDYIAAGIPAEKDIAGRRVLRAPLAHEPNADPLYGQATYKNTLAYTQIKRQIDKNPAAVYYDEIAQAPYYADGRIFISYDDARSIAQKRQYAQDQGLLGLFAWQYGSDETGELVGRDEGRGIACGVFWGGMKRGYFSMENAQSKGTQCFLPQSTDGTANRQSGGGIAHENHMVLCLAVYSEIRVSARRVIFAGDGSSQLGRRISYSAVL